MSTATPLMTVAFALAAQESEPSGTPLWFFVVLGLVIIAVLLWALLSRSWETSVGEREEAGRAFAAEPEPMLMEPEPEPVMAEPEPVMAEPEMVPDDLLLIEGIGPKIKEVLADAGITTFAALAATDVATLEKIVQEDAGITIAHPDTWPRQAQLAGAGDWDAFQHYIDGLKGGREVEPD